MGKKKSFQYVWPKDGPKGRSGRRGFFGRFGDVMTGKGPDIFLQRKGSKTAIKPDQWGNWDSYHNPRAHNVEELHGEQNPFYNSSRGTKRYDPYTRKYVNWAAPNDWYGTGVDGMGILPHGNGYPRFTQKEVRRMSRRHHQGRRINPLRMGSEWNDMGPKRFRPEHDWFWQEAHALGEAFDQGYDRDFFGSNNMMSMGQHHPDELRAWLRRELS